MVKGGYIRITKGGVLKLKYCKKAPKVPLFESEQISQDPLAVLPMFDGSQDPDKYCALFEEVVCHPRLQGVNISKLFSSLLEG